MFIEYRIYKCSINITNLQSSPEKGWTDRQTDRAAAGVLVARPFNVEYIAIQ